MENEANKSLSFGERLVGLNFNPSNDDSVSKAKRLCADLADLIDQERSQREYHSELSEAVYSHAIGEILNAQMNAVKFLTLKY